MLHLENHELRLDLLDPVADAVRQGPRYCWGGYVWQVHDRTHGPLLSGPVFPDPTPTPFDGQGLPESFRHLSRDGRNFTLRGRAGVAIGAGRLAVDDQNNVTLTEPCVWEISPFADHLEFHTRQAAAGFSYELLRRIELTDRTVRSHTQLTNHGEQPLVLQWFPHPFFPLQDGRTRADFPAGTTMPENPGFALVDRTLTFKRPFTRKGDSQFVLFGLPAGRELSVVLDHPCLDRVEFSTSFAPDECPVWGNAHTFSVEPYLNLDLAPGQTRHWSVQTRFGEGT